MIVGKGLGSDTNDMFYCSQGWVNYLTASACWKQPKSYWDNGGLPQAVAPKAPADALTNPTGAYSDPQVGQDLSNQAISATQNGVTNFFTDFSTNPLPDPTACSFIGIGCGTWALIGIGLIGVTVLLGDVGPRRYGR